MIIETGKFYVNKTWRFLMPCLRGHGEEFITKFNLIYKLAVGIHDMLLDGSTISDGRNIYILCDKSVNDYRFNEFLNYIRNQLYYVADYCPESEILESTQMMIVLTIPIQFSNSYDSFLKGKYSEMYSKQEYNILFKDKKLELDIINKEPKLIQQFVKEVNNEFKVFVLESDFLDAELELPLKKHQEIFNYKQNDTLFFNHKIDKTWSTIEN